MDKTTAHSRLRQIVCGTAGVPNCTGFSGGIALAMRPRGLTRQFDDSSWEVLNGTRITAREQPRSGWSGIGWFRLHLSVDPLLASEPLGLEFWNLGASELYVDGKLVKQFGRVGADAESEQVFNPIRVPFGIVFDKGEHVIAVRLSVMSAANLNSIVAGLANSNNTVGALRRKIEAGTRRRSTAPRTRAGAGRTRLD